MRHEITMRELIVLVICFILYVVAVEVYEAKIEVSRQGMMSRQEQNFRYEPPKELVSEDGLVVKMGK